ncbi:MAG: sigma 54-interacting transcriptional regulator [Planctomycetota bacterium]
MATDEGRFFREMTLRICASLDIDQALASAFDYLQDQMPADALGLGFSDLPAGQIRVVAKVARAGATYLWKDGAPAIDLSDEMIDYIRSKPASDAPSMIINRPGEHPAPFLDAFPQLVSSSALFMRLDVRGEEVGALLLSAEGPDRYSDEHVRLIHSIREPFAIAMINARRYHELVRLKDVLADDNRALSADIKRVTGTEVVGADFGLRSVMDQVRQVAPSSSPALLLGETGTGKEVIANAIHMASRRSAGPMISMQCGAIPETLLDSELFGHERGAFTGASERKRGRFERADGGTLFLDEIGELSPEAQVKLLRVLQEKRFERVGGTSTLEVDVRVIAATHRDLGRMVQEGSFREDLWYRLNVLPIRIPPLRLRREDIPSLLQHFIERKTKEMSLSRTPRVTAADIEMLRSYDWPGNVRELQNAVERALIVSTGDTLDFHDLVSSSPPQPRALGGAPRRLSTMDEAIASHIRSVLDSVHWQVAGSGGAAEVLAMNPSTLRFRMKKLGVTQESRSRG